jgi:hypothetical protein
MNNIFDLYKSMEENKVMLSFKGIITVELMSSILQIMESKMEFMDETPRVKRKVYNVLVECLQNLYHHVDKNEEDELKRTSIFMIIKDGEEYAIQTGNFLLPQHVDDLRGKLELINDMDRDELKTYYKEVLSNGVYSSKGTAGLGMIDMARKSGRKLEFNFENVDENNSFFSLTVKVA